MTRSEHPNGMVRPGGTPRTCGVCGEPGHTRRRHNGVDLPLPGELVTVEQMAPGPPDRVVPPVPAGEPEPGNNCDHLDDGDWHPRTASCSVGKHGTGDLLAELADGYDVQPATPDRVQALRDMVSAVRRDPAISYQSESELAGARHIVGEQGPEPLQVLGEDAPNVLGPTGVIYVCATCGDPTESEPCRRHQPAAWAECVGPEFAAAELAASAIPVVGDFPAGFREHFGIDPDPTTSEDDCRCLGSGPDEVHPIGAPQCMYPQGLIDAGELRPIETVELPVEDIRQLPYPWCTFPPPAGTVFDQPFVIREPGVYVLDETTYHADPVLGGSLSNSGGRKLSATCPAQYRHDVDGQVVEVRDVWDFGKLAHAEVLGKGAVAAVRPAEWKDYRKDAAKAWRDEARAAGLVPITPEDYETVKAMAAALRDHPRAVELLDQPGQREAVLAWRDPLTGAWERAMLDHLPDSPAPGQRMVIVDYKTTDKPAPDADMMRAIYNHGYHRQAAKYRKGVVLLGLAEDALMVFVFQSKTKPYLVSVVRCDPRSLQIGDIENRRALQTFADCQRTGNWPGYGDGVHELPLPRYIEMQFEGEV